MASIVIAGDTSGSVTLQAPAVAGSTVLNLPSTSGTIQTSGAGYTTNGVAYATSTSALSTGSALTFDGTNFTVGYSSGSSRFNVSNNGSGGFEINPDGTASGPTLIAYNRGSSAYLQLTSQASNHVWQNSGTETMRLTSTGLGIGTSSPSAKLDVRGIARVNEDNAGTKVIQLRSDWAGVDPAVQVVTNNSLLFVINGTERARIDTSGNLLVGTTTAGGVGFSLTDNAGAKCTTTQRASGTGATNMCLFVNPNGTVGTIQISGSSTSYNTSSDYRLKNTIAPMTGALAKVALLKPVTYKWNADGSNGEGFIAHELAEVVPNCVSGQKDAVETYVDEDGNEQSRPVYQGIDTSFLVATLTAAIQEMKTIIDDQAARLTALENK